MLNLYYPNSRYRPAVRPSLSIFAMYAAYGAFALAAFGLTAGSSNAAGAADGEKIFNRTCALCHSINAGENLIGPSLAGVVGRRSGQAAGYDYSDANRNSGLTWDRGTLDRYLTDPRGVVPGTKMSFPGLKDPAERQAVIGFLESRSGNHASLSSN